MTVTELRPLSLGELLDRTFSYYRSHFWVFVGIMAVPQVFLVGVDLLRQALTRPGSIVGVNSQRSEEQFLTGGEIFRSGRQRRVYVPATRSSCRRITGWTRF